LCAGRAVGIIPAIQEVPMIVERLDLPAAHALPRRAGLRRAWDWWWWSVRAYVADRHLLPRPEPPDNL
jgi:hypothetical protein